MKTFCDYHTPSLPAAAISPATLPISSTPANAATLAKNLTQTATTSLPAPPLVRQVADVVKSPVKRLVAPNPVYKQREDKILSRSSGKSGS